MWNQIANLSIQMLFLAFQAPSPAQMQVGTAYPSGILVTSNQLLQPAGKRIEFAGSPTDMAVSPDGGTIALTVGSTVTLYSVSGTGVRTLQLPAAVTYAGVAFSPDGQQLAVSNASGVTIFTLSTLAAKTIALPDPVPCGLVFDPSRPAIYVALNSANQVARIDLTLGRITGTLSVGVAPLGLALTPNGGRLFVSNWGGRHPATGEPSALSNGTAVLVNAHGLAASGTVSAIDLDSFALLGQINVGLHPSGIQASPDGSRVAVANANSDSVSVIDAAALTVVSSIHLPAMPAGYIGSSPTSLAFNADASRLYVTCAGNNSVVSLVLKNGQYQVAAVAPTDWYPVALAVSAVHGVDTVFVANAKGIGSRASQGTYNVNQRLGTMGRVGAGDFGGVRLLSPLNDPFNSSVAPVRNRGAASNAGTLSLGSLGVKHVFLIVKENRTYDQVLGDLEAGNGSPELAIYGSNVTPNQHHLASQFVTLDNFYATGVVSADGHQWITQGMTSDYAERSYTAGWPRSYPYAGDDPLVFAPAGFLWDNAIRNGLSVHLFGEFTVPASAYQGTWAAYLADAQSPRMQYATPSRSPVSSVQSIVEAAYPAFALNVPDQFRARIFLDRFQQYVQDGNLPNLIILWLPADHTNGTAPGTPAPQTMVADNDLALGRIVEAVSASPYWGSSAIFVTEDDAQNGVDHVDGHRTICLVASPFARRGVVDSTSYNQTSIIRTIEDLLGLPPMNKFDAAALSMLSVFGRTPDDTPFRALPNQVVLAKVNPPLEQLRGAERQAAAASAKMNFSVPDAAPEEVLNRILWHAAKGWNISYPKIPHRPDCRPHDDDK